MRFTRSLAICFSLFAASLSLAAAPVYADPPAETIRAVSGKYKAAVVTLTIVVKMSGGGSGGESEMEIPGFVIDPTGLVVTTNTAIDPMAMFAGMDMEGMGGFTSKVISAKILTTNGDEIPAKIVLRDSDRNVVFFRPISPVSEPLTFVDLKAGGTARIGDPLYILSRLGTVGNRAPQVQSMRVVSVMERPRTLYVADTLGMTMIGNPAFNEQGTPLGLVTMRMGTASRRRGNMFSPTENYLPVILPAEDVMELARQAPQVKDVKESDITPLAPKKPATTTKPAGKPTTKPAPAKPPKRP
jgi:hypothetical protein